MDEGSLEAAIEAYSAQLQQVESVLSAGLDPSQQSDLLQLKDDLSQLIGLTEASLLSVKKSRLLASLEEGDAHLPQATDVTANGEFAAFYFEVGEVSGSSSDTRERGNEREDEDEGAEDDDAEEEEEEVISGTKVRAPYRTSWGTLEYHNAMVVGTESSDGDESQVRVLYVHPTQKSLKPCPYFLEDKCRFMDNCRFSHGEVVYVSELREFLEPDLSKLQEGSSCLARQEDGIWYPAKITNIDSGFYTVKFESLLMKDVTVEADGIIPPMREDDLLTSGSEDDDSVEGEAAFAKVFDSTEEEALGSSSTSTFGGWEAHTRGIGSKLMMKMGYEYGKGLGKMSEGRVEPVLAVVLPKGTSLDKCGELTARKTQSKVAKDRTQTSHRKRIKKPRAGSSRGRHNVFDFLNRKLGDEGTDPKDGASGEPPPSSSRGAGVEAYRGGKSTKRTLNVKLFQAAERVAQTEREIQRLTESLSRRTGRHSTVVGHLEEKLSAARMLLTQQKAQELSVQKEHRKSDTHKKMTEF